MSDYSLYRLADGILTGVTLSDNALDESIPAGQAAIEGRHDHLSRRVDLGSGEVVDYQPPAPADDEWRTWAWNSETRRWIAGRTLAAYKRDEGAPLIEQLAALDDAARRPTEEITLAMALAEPVPAAAVARLQALRAEKDVIRASLAAINALTEIPA